MALGPPSPATDGTEYVGDTTITAKIRLVTHLPAFMQPNGSLCIAKYAGGSRIHPHRLRPRPTMALGPPSPATDGTEYVGDTILTANICPATRLPASMQPNGS